jgi:hypothetical protein
MATASSHRIYELSADGELTLVESVSDLVAQPRAIWGSPGTFTIVGLDGEAATPPPSDGC